MTLPNNHHNNLLLEVVRLGLDKEISPDGTYYTYFPFGLMIERPRMAIYHNKYLLLEVVRLGLDKEISPDGTYYAYFPFGLMIERPRMATYHDKYLLLEWCSSGADTKYGGWDILCVFPIRHID